MARLESINRALAHKIEKADEESLRAIISAAWKYAVDKADLREKLAHDIMGLFHEKRDLPGSARVEVEAFLEKYDQQYFDLYDQNDERYMIPFRKGRCFSLLLFCFGIEDLGMATAEIVYEAASLCDEPEELFHQLEPLL